MVLAFVLEVKVWKMSDEEMLRRMAGPLLDDPNNPNDRNNVEADGGGTDMGKLYNVIF